jgi:ethanolamine utilization protein EutN
MRIGEVIGTVTLNRCHPSFVGTRLKLAVPLALQDLLGSKSPPQADTLVVWDDLGAGVGSKIAISEGGEAAQPFRPHDKPVDAYCAALLDQIDVALPQSP